MHCKLISRNICVLRVHFSKKLMLQSTSIALFAFKINLSHFSFHGKIGPFLQKLFESKVVKVGTVFNLTDFSRNHMQNLIISMLSIISIIGLLLNTNYHLKMASFWYNKLAYCIKEVFSHFFAFFAKNG